MNKTLSILLATFLSVMLPSVVSAAALPEEPEEEEAVITLPEFTDSYDAKACAAVRNPASPCNKGAEPFCQFLKKFNSSKQFRASRIIAEEYLKRALLTVYPGHKTISPITTSRPSKKNDYDLSTWTLVEADSVWYIAGYMPPFDDDDVGISARWHFERKNGKWYLTWGIVI